MDLQTRHILECLEENARISHYNIALLTGLTTEEVSSRIKQLEKAKIIKKYKTLIDWELAGEDKVYAIIELNIALERNSGYQKIAERLYKFPEILSVKLLSGQYDLSLTVVGKTMKEVAFFVAEKISTLEQVQHTTTHFILKSYKEDGVILEDQEENERLLVSP